jgi:hypothetical protein
LGQQTAGRYAVGKKMHRKGIEMMSVRAHETRIPDSAETNDIRQTVHIVRHRKGGACDGLPSIRDSAVTQAACAACV